VARLNLDQLLAAHVFLDLPASFLARVEVPSLPAATTQPGGRHGAKPPLAATPQSARVDAAQHGRKYACIP
jgi:hypothetical protein